MPSSWAARSMRRAISPRLAIRIFRNTQLASGRTDPEQGLTVLDRILVLHQDLGDHSVGFGLDLVHQLHRLDDAQYGAAGDPVTDLDVIISVRSGSGVEGTDDRSAHVDQLRIESRGDPALSGRGRAAALRGCRCSGLSDRC